MKIATYMKFIQYNNGSLSWHIWLDVSISKENLDCWTRTILVHVIYQSIFSYARIFQTKNEAGSSQMKIAATILD